MSIYQLGDIAPDIHENAWVAPTAAVIGNVIMAEHSSVWFGAVLRGDNEPIRIGERSNIQDNSILHTDPGCPLDIGREVIVGHRVMLHGCTIGDGSLIGIGATILNRAKIGKNCLIGAHALITEDKVIPDNSMVIGAPGKVIKTLNDNQIAMLRLNAEVYVKNAERFERDLKKL